LKKAGSAQCNVLSFHCTLCKHAVFTFSLSLLSMSTEPEVRVRQSFVGLVRREYGDDAKVQDGR
jgi:hypothetical protein